MNDSIRNSQCTARTTRLDGERGVALIIVIIALLLVTAVAAGMILASNSEINIDANYRDEQVALFAAKAGLQEARDRMLAGNANPLTLPTTLPGNAGGVYADYIVASGITPWTIGKVYGVPTFDSEFMCEMGSCAGTAFPNAASCCTSVASNASYSGPAANPVPYQWVRINLKQNETVDTSTGAPRWVSTAMPATGQVYFDQTSLTQCVWGSLSGPCATSSTLEPVYEVTSFAVTPAGTFRMVQDEIAPVTFNLNLSSPLNIPGTVGSFSGGNSQNYQINGTDGSGNKAPAVPGCTPSGAAGPAVAVSTSGSATTVEGGTPRPGNYSGGQCTYSSTPCVGGVSLPTSMGTPAELDQTIAEIGQAADGSPNACLAAGPCPPATPVNPPPTYSWGNVLAAMPGGTWSDASTDPRIVYVDGNLDISASSGSGILVVTGNLTYDGNSSWNGIVLVVGEGTTTFNTNGGGNGQFNGAFFVATTRDANGNQLTNFGTADFNVNGGGGSGIYFNSCWVSKVQQPQTFQLLSGKEIE